MATDTFPGERIITEIRKLKERVRNLEQSNPGLLLVTDDDENPLAGVGRFSSTVGGLRLYAPDGSVLWEQTRAI